MNERIFDKSGKLIGFKGVCGCGATFTGGVYSARRELCDDCKKINRKFSHQKYYKKNPHRKEQLPKRLTYVAPKKAKVCTCCGLEPVMKGNRFLCRNCFTGNTEPEEYTCSVIVGMGY